jgi:hypothetical protein
VGSWARATWPEGCVLELLRRGQLESGVDRCDVPVQRPGSARKGGGLPFSGPVNPRRASLFCMTMLAAAILVVLVGQDLLGWANRKTR